MLDCAYVGQTIPRTSRSLFGDQQPNNCVTTGNSTLGRATLMTLSLVSVISVVLAACPSYLPAARMVITVTPSLELGTLNASRLQQTFSVITKIWALCSA